MSDSDAGAAAGPAGIAGREPGEEERRLWRAAAAAAPRAYAPYSGLQVGAAVLAGDGSVHLGVNVENASYPVGMCAERAALAAAVTAGSRRLTAVAVAAADGRDLLPCGACLQALAEFGAPAIVARTGGEQRVYELRALLAAPFDLPRP